jgi:hypothetical protein
MWFMGFRPLTAVVLIVALVAGASSALAARHPAVGRNTNTITSTGSGRQVLEGAGLTYGTLLPGGVVRLIDLSPKHDAKFTVTAQVPATQTTPAQSVGVKYIRLGPMLIFKVKQARLKASLAFSVGGSRFRLVLDGTSTLNGAAVIGKVQLDGTGTIAVNGQTPPVEWQASPRVVLAAHAATPLPARTTTTTTPTTTTPTTPTTTS